MNSTDPRLQALLAALGAHVGIADLVFNDDHVCRLVLDGTLIIDLEHQPGAEVLQVYSVVGADPGGNAELCRRLLSANLFGQGTGGAVLALDDQRGELLLVQTFDAASVSPEKFVATLDSYVGYVQSWTEELLNADEDSDDDLDDPRGGLSAQNSAFIRV